MAEKQQIYRVRRKYNQWVNNQTLEDYALRFTAKAARHWSLGRVASTALGAISFLALEAIGAVMTINYGFDNTMLAVAVVSFVIFFVGLPICFYAAKYGVDIDLLTRGAGFGYLGSTATSVIYASFTFIFFALEASIMAKALELAIGLPLALGYIVSSVVVIPLVFYGITFISRFQVWTQPVWMLLQITPFVFILFQQSELTSQWLDYKDESQESGLNILMFGAAASAMFALIAQHGEQVDFLRFFPEKTKDNSIRWWLALIAAGPGWIIIGAIKIIIGSFLAVVAINYGASLEEAVDPTSMYQIAFGFVTNNQHLALFLAGFFVVISQLKINVTNAYAGSIAWSNFFSRLTHSHPGRVVWLVFNVIIALMLMELGIYHAFENTLSVYAIVAVSWMGALVSDLIINKPLGLSPKHIEFKRAYLYDINPVGMGSMIIASAFGVFAYLGFFGEYPQALAHFLSLGLSIIFVPIIALLTKGKYYIARDPYIFTSKQLIVQCSICKNNYETEDVAHCPAYEGYICSLCCSLDVRCQDSCKPSPSVFNRFVAVANKWLPMFAHSYINVRLVHFISLLIGVGLITALLLTLVYTNAQSSNFAFNQMLEDTLWKVFFILMIIAGVICWLFVLAHQSQIVSQEETHNQTTRLIDEIYAHKKTDLKLQKAKEEADASNLAKSRYLTGISHELRSPLNTILGYAQLMEMNPKSDRSTLDKVSSIKKSGEHLEDLIEGLLEISKIEAGRIEMQRNPIQFIRLINQIDKMFKVQASDKNLFFNCIYKSNLPKAVIGDEKRVRQILINLLSNAIKFTEKGGVEFSISYRNQVAEFKIKDSGIGIDPSEYKRIFKAFERVRAPGKPSVPGTGLGLTISRLFIEIMGGDIQVEINPTGGTIFTLSLMLSSIDLKDDIPLKPKQIFGYDGDRITIMVVDDDASHRSLISDLLMPLGFEIIEAYDAYICLEMIENINPDLFIIDRRMPGMNGPELSNKLRQLGFDIPILMVTANAKEDTLSVIEYDQIKDSDISMVAYNDYLIKPIRLPVLLKSIEDSLNIVWQHEPAYVDMSNDLPKIKKPDIASSLVKEIIENAEMGNLNELKKNALMLSNIKNIDPNFMLEFNHFVKEIRFNKIIELMKVKS